jgi:hypothetical protein
MEKEGSCPRKRSSLRAAKERPAERRGSGNGLETSLDRVARWV